MGQAFDCDIVLAGTPGAQARCGTDDISSTGKRDPGVNKKTGPGRLRSAVRAGPAVGVPEVGVIKGARRVPWLVERCWPRSGSGYRRWYVLR